MSNQIDVFDEISKLKNTLSEKDYIIHLKNLEINSLKSMLKGKETVRCSGCGTPLEKFFFHGEVQLSQFIKWIRKGEKVEAVKSIRVETGWSLSSAKHFTDKISKQFKRFDN